MYIAGRVDKACLLKAEEPRSGVPKQIKTIGHYAELKTPYAVFTKSGWLLHSSAPKG